jgi:hypothetical protein
MKRPYILVAGMAASFVVAAPASAATSLVTGTVTAGTLSIDTVATPTFGVTLNGINQVATYTVPSTVIDATGSDAGWHLTVSSTPFTDSSFALADDASHVTGVVSSCDTTCTDPLNAIGYPLSIPADGNPVDYFNADVGTGAGKFTNTPTIAVDVPANTHAGTYTSTLTLAAVSGP